MCVCVSVCVSVPISFRVSVVKERVPKRNIFSYAFMHHNTNTYTRYRRGKWNRQP